MERSPEDWLRAALPAYGLDGCPFTLLQTFGDVVARVETLAGPRSLRVNLPGSGERQEEIQRFLYSAASGREFPLRARAVMGVCTATSFLEWVYGSANEQVREKKLKWIPALLERLSGQGE